MRWEEIIGQSFFEAYNAGATNAMYANLKPKSGPNRGKSLMKGGKPTAGVMSPTQMWFRLNPFAKILETYQAILVVNALTQIYMERAKSDPVYHKAKSSLGFEKEKLETKLKKYEGHPKYSAANNPEHDDYEEFRPQLKQMKSDIDKLKSNFANNKTLKQAMIIIWLADYNGKELNAKLPSIKA